MHMRHKSVYGIEIALQIDGPHFPSFPKGVILRKRKKKMPLSNDYIFISSSTAGSALLRQIKRYGTKEITLTKDSKSVECVRLDVVGISYMAVTYRFENQISHIDLYEKAKAANGPTN